MVQGLTREAYERQRDAIYHTFQRILQYWAQKKYIHQQDLPTLHHLIDNLFQVVWSAKGIDTASYETVFVLLSQMYDIFTRHRDDHPYVRRMCSIINQYVDDGESSPLPIFTRVVAEGKKTLQ